MPTDRERQFGYRAHFERMGYTEELAGADAIRRDGGDMDAVADAYPSEALLAVGYYGKPDGAAAAFAKARRGAGRGAGARHRRPPGDRIHPGRNARLRARKSAGGDVKRRLVNLLKAIVAAAIYAAIFWYSFSVAGNPDLPSKAMIGLISLGIAYGVWTAVFKVAGEIAGGAMVLAEFLNRHLLEPQKRRLLEEGRQEGRKEGLEEGRERGRAELSAEIRARLEERGLNPNEILPDENADQSDE